MRTRMIALLASVVALPALAQAPMSAAPMAAAPMSAAPKNYRGTLEAAAPGHVRLHERGGADLDFVLADNARIGLTRPITLDAIKPGSYIGCTSVTRPDGIDVALEVHVFPEVQRGTGQGSYPYDLKPDSTMTNGTVGDVLGIKGRTVEINYGAGKRTIMVPPETPVVTTEPAPASIIKPGAKAVLAAVKGEDGVLRIVRIAVGKDGMMPPT